MHEMIVYMPALEYLFHCLFDITSVYLILPFCSEWLVCPTCVSNVKLKYISGVGWGAKLAGQDLR